MLGTRLIMME